MTWRHVAHTADDASLLRDWLAEVLVAFEVNGVVGREFAVRTGPNGLQGAVRGCGRWGSSRAELPAPAALSPRAGTAAPTRRR